MLDLQKVALAKSIGAKLLFNENTGTTITDVKGRIPPYTVLGTTTGLWDTSDRITYHSAGNGHARIVADSGVDRLFRQDDIDGVGGFLFFTGINYPAKPAANQRLFHYGGKDPTPVTGGVNCRIDGGGGGGNTTFSFSSHPPASVGTDLALTSSTITAAADHTIAVYLDRTTAGDVTGTWYIDGVADTTATVTHDPPQISADSGTQRGLVIGGRSTSPPDTLFTDGSLWGMQFHKYYFDASSQVASDIAKLHANYTALVDANTGSNFNDLWANWLQNNTTTTEQNFIDAQNIYLDAQGISDGNLNDRWYEWLGDAGYTGTYQDRWDAYWIAQGI